MRINISLGLFAILSASALAQQVEAQSNVVMTDNANSVGTGTGTGTGAGAGTDKSVVDAPVNPPAGGNGPMNAAVMPTTTYAVLQKPGATDTPATTEKNTQQWQPKKGSGRQHRKPKCTCLEKHRGRKGRGRGRVPCKYHRKGIRKGLRKGIKHGVKKGLRKAMRKGIRKSMHHRRPHARPNYRVSRPMPYPPYGPYPGYPYSPYNPYRPIYARDQSVNEPVLASRQLKVSTDGTCGNGNTCAGNPEGSCCSQYGFCGKSEAYCGAGCQPAFGTCNGGAAAPPDPALAGGNNGDKPQDNPPATPPPEANAGGQSQDETAQSDSTGSAGSDGTQQ